MLTKVSARFASTLTKGQKPRVLVTGGAGLVGSLIVQKLRAKYGDKNVIASDVRRDTQTPVADPFEVIDITDFKTLERVVKENKINWIINQSAILSVACEMNPHLAMDVNIGGFRNVMEVSRLNNCRVFSASTIASFGPSTPKVMTPDITIQRPPSLYGSTKVSNELIGEFYNRKWGVDFRCLRYPTVIAPEGEARGRVVDFAVQIFAEAIKSGHYVCDVAENSCLPFQLVDDTADATIKFMEAPNEALTVRTYNTTAFSCTIGQLAKAIQKVVPNYKVEYKSNPIKQLIIDGMPDSLDDTRSQKDWGWKASFPMEKCVETVIDRLKKIHGKK